MTTLYGTTAANGTLTNACNMVTVTGGAETSKTTTFTGSSTWAEVYSQGGTFATVSSIGSPDGHGWVYQPGSGSFAAGNWSASVTLAFASKPVSLTIRFYKYSGGSYTSIGTIVVSSGLSTAKTTYSFAATSMGSVSFGSSDLLYIDAWVYDNNSNASGDNPSVYESSNAAAGIAGDMAVTTSAFSSSGTQADHDLSWRGLLNKQVDYDLSWRGLVSKTVAHDLSWRGVLGNISGHDLSWRALLAQTGDHDLSWRGKMGHVIGHDLSWRGLLARVTGTHDLSWRGLLAPISPDPFYASNVAQTIGGLTASCQMATTTVGGSETSFTVTAPASGTNSYVELISQGGTPSATSALPAPTGKGWSISMAGQTFPSGNWYGTFTLAKSGTAKSGATLVVRFYRRTIDGTSYLIAQNTLSGQTFNTTKTIYSCVTVQTAAAPWQFISGDTLYMDAFVYNGGTGWASDVFTVYVSSSASGGMLNEGSITCPQPVATSAGLTALVGTGAYATLSSLSLKNESFQLADSIDQRSILSLTAEDVPGTALYTRGQPIMFSDSNMGLLYTGWVNSDKITKIAAGAANAQLEHQMTFMDNHYLADKKVNSVDYLNWTAGDIACDFVQSNLSAEGVVGDFALESDYTPTTLGAGTLTNAVTTTTTTPFVYAPNTATPPIVSNTGDLEIQAAGTPFTLTEQYTADFSSGTLTNMTAANNSLAPTTQQAVKVTAVLPQAPALSNTVASATYSSGSWTVVPEAIINSAYAQIWSGSLTIGSNDTFNYDIWIASTSPAFMAGVDFHCSDGTTLTAQCGTPDSNGAAGLYDSNSLSVDALTDLSIYAKDTWYTRTITLTGLSGKTVTTVSVYFTGSQAGTYTVFIKNCYLGSQAGSPFFGTSATQTTTNPPVVTTLGGYVAAAVIPSVVSVYRPTSSSRISPAHSISNVGLVRSSSVTWTASLPTTGAAQAVYPPGAASPVTPQTSGGTSTPGMLLFVSYDGTTWLPCENQKALPGLPPGANTGGLSLYLLEQFQCGPDPSAIPALEYVYITITSAANTSTSDVVAAYGTAATWNTGTSAGAAPNANGDLALAGATQSSPAWTSLTSQAQTFYPGQRSPTQSASGGAYTISMPLAANLVGSAATRFDFAGAIADFTLTCHLSVNGTNSTYGQSAVLYRTVGWSNTNYYNYDYAYAMMISTDGYFQLWVGSNAATVSAGTANIVAKVSKSISLGTSYPIKIVVKGNHHQGYFNNETTPSIDVIDTTYPQAGYFGVYNDNGGSASSSNTTTTTISNFVLTNAASGLWTSPAISLSALGTVGYSQLSWAEVSTAGQLQATAIVQASLDGGSTWQSCTNNASVPQLATRGTSVAGKSLLVQVVLTAANALVSPIIEGLYVRVCGPYGTVTGTRVSPALSLTPVGYVSNSNCMWNANVPTNTSVTIATSQDGASWTNVGNSGAGAAISYWTNQPSATDDQFTSNTSANYTNTYKSGGSAATVTYDTGNSRIIVSGGSGGLYLNSSISSADTELFVDMDESDAGGLVWQEQNTSNYYELGVYDASSSGGYTNQLRLYKVSSGTRTLLGSASSITFNRGTYHRIKVIMKGALINVYWDGGCVQSYLDTAALGAGLCGLRNDGGTSRYYQLWVQPLGTNLSGQVLYTRTTLTTTDPAYMPQLFTLVAAVRGAAIQTGATIAQLHPVTTPFAQYFSTEMDTLVQASGDYFWYLDQWRKLQFRPRLARPAAFPLQSVADVSAAGVSTSGSLLYQFPQSVLLTSANDLFRNQQVVTDVTNLVNPPPEIKTADGTSTSWTMGYPLYSAPVVLINGQSSSVGIQGIDNNKQFYWQPGSPSISYDSTLPVLPAGTVLSFTYTGETVVNDIQNNTASQAAQAAIEYNTSGIIAEIESALNSTTRGMTVPQATTFANGLLTRFGTNNAVELVGVVNYFGPSPGAVLRPGTFTSLFLPEMSQNDLALPIIKITLQGFQKSDGTVYYTQIVDATNGPNTSRWQQAWSQ